MFCTMQVCAWSMATIAASSPKGGGGEALEEEAVASASYRATAVALASRAVAEAYSFFRRRVMEQTRA
jgi:hypothetical protein